MLQLFHKVPLFIFKREKEVCRSLLFDGLYIAEQPSEDDVMAHWDKLVISTHSFPENYWDKFVKKSVSQSVDFKYCLYRTYWYWGILKHAELE